eukprot:TRINITY_DN6168_c0_g1_i1.p1 TRINITY_DN6168_c0_g1~~TRINITY_DN6168_c0_g1_i1.p1  ORF type:complete len:133 (+),score=43.09 TRINITY_DN6168_c0_g1_i1:45-401(+)
MSVGGTVAGIIIFLLVVILLAVLFWYLWTRGYFNKWFNIGPEGHSSSSFERDSDSDNEVDYKPHIKVKKEKKLKTKAGGKFKEHGGRDDHDPGDIFWGSGLTMAEEEIDWGRNDKPPK